MRISVEGDTISMHGYVYERDVAEFTAAFARVDGRYPVVRVNLHSLGGSVFGGNMIYNALLAAKSEVHVRVVGVAASMGFVIMLAGSRIEMVENGFCMSHEATGSTYGTAREHEANAKLLRAINESFLRKLMARTGKPEAEAKKWLEGDNWFDAKEAKQLGFIDGIIDPLGTLDISDPAGMDREELAAAFEAALNTTPPGHGGGDGHNTDDMDKETLLARLGLELPADASDTEVIGAVKAEMDKLKAEADRERQAREELQASVDGLKASAVERLLAAGRKSGAVTDTNEAHYRKVGMESGTEVLEGILSGMPPRKPLADALNAPTGRGGWDWEKYQAEDPQALERMRVEDPEGFNALFKARFGVDYED